MTHPRNTIREKIKATLIAADITSIESNVFKSRRSPIQAGDDGAVPVLLIYTGDEIATVGEWGETKLLRELAVGVEIVGKDTAADTLEDGLDDIADEVETALKDLSLLEAGALENVFLDLIYTGKKPRLSEIDGEEYVAGMILTFTVRYVY